MMLSHIKWAIASNSLGTHPSHSLERKLCAAVAHNFTGIEIVHGELLAHAAEHGQAPLASAQQVRALATFLNLTIVSLSPLKHFDGNNALPLAERLARAREWITLAVALGALHLQVPTGFLPHSVGDEEVLATELAAIADAAAEASAAPVPSTSGPPAPGEEKRPLSIAYEPVAFATHTSTWQFALRIIQRADRPNIGLCLDSFHLHARLWGDAQSESGVQVGGEEALRASLDEFALQCPRKAIAYMQLSDAVRFAPPLRMDDARFDGLEKKDERLLWSRFGRPFPLEAAEGGYFPVVETMRTWLVDKEFDGWVSMESFLPLETGREEGGPETMAARGWTAVQKIGRKLERESKDGVLKNGTGKS